ncbi:MAG: hypothetical protein CVU91_05005 [Firmicutes bacterium HGW-Firmicutes-16]|nr:MAG: hypothetical protein CVU91_05005 [Firmicutes bacterium HGW-Firmicutes-16]
MKYNRGVVIGIGIFFGVVTFIITVFFTSPQLALSLGSFTAATYILVISILMDINVNKYKNIDETIGQDIILKDTANYYCGKLIGNGILYLTADRLTYISLEKRLYIEKKYYYAISKEQHMEKYLSTFLA